MELHGEKHIGINHAYLIHKINQLFASQNRTMKKLKN